MPDRKTIEEALSQTLADAVFDVSTPAQASRGMFEFPSFDELVPPQSTQDKKAKKERDVLKGLGEFGTQFASKGVETATIGISKFAFGESEEAETLGGKIGATLGTVAGFMVPMTTFSALGRVGVKAASKFSGKKTSEFLLKETKDIIGTKGLKIANKKADPLSPLKQADAESLFYKEVVEKEFLKPIETWGSGKHFKTLADRNKFDSDLMQFAGRNMEKRANELGLKLGKLEKDPTTGKMVNSVIKRITDTYKQEWTRVGGRPITEMRQQIARAIPYGNEGLIASGLALMAEEGLIFSMVEGGMHVVNTTGGFHQHDGTEAKWDELPEVMGQAFVLGNLLGVGRLLPGGVKGGAMPNLFKKSGRDQTRAIFGYLPKFADKYNPVGTAISNTRDRTSLYNMHRHFDRMGDAKLNNITSKGFDSHPLRSLFPKNQLFGRLQQRSIIQNGTQEQKEALGVMLKDNLKSIGNHVYKEWKPEFLSLLGKDIRGSQLRMGWGGMVLGGGPGVLFDENIMFEDKMIGFLTGYLLFKSGKELTYRKGDSISGESWATHSGYKPEFGETRQRLSEQADMWSALGVEFGGEPWSTVIRKSRESSKLGEFYDIDTNLMSSKRLRDTLEISKTERDNPVKYSDDVKKITTDKDFIQTKKIHEEVLNQLETDKYMDTNEVRIRPLEEHSYAEYNKIKKQYKANNWEEAGDIQFDIVKSKTNSWLTTSLESSQSIAKISGLLERSNGEKFAVAKQLKHKGAPEKDAAGQYNYASIPKISFGETFQETIRQRQARDWYNNFVDFTERDTSSMKGGSKVKLENEVKIEKGDKNIDLFFSQVEGMKKAYETATFKTFEVDPHADILFNNSIMHQNSESFRLVHEVERFTNFFSNISDKSNENRTERELQISSSLKDLFTLDKPGVKSDLFLDNLNYHYFGFNKLQKNNRAFVESMMPIVSTLGRTPGRFEVQKNSRKKLNNAEVTVLRELMEVEGFTFMTDPRYQATFSNSVLDVLTRKQLRGTGLNINQRAMVTHLYTTPLTKGRHSKNLHEGITAFDLIDNFKIKTDGWQGYFGSEKFNALSNKEKGEVRNIHEAMKRDKIGIEDLNDLQQEILPLMKTDKGGWFVKSDEIAILSPTEYMKIISELKYFKRVNTENIKYPRFIKDLSQILKDEKNQFYPVAKEIGKLIGTNSKKDGLHMFTLLEQKQLLNDKSVLGFKVDAKEPETQMDMHISVIKEAFNSKDNVAEKSMDDYYREKYEDGELTSELYDNPIRGVDRLFDKYIIGGKIFKDKRNSVLKTEQLKDTFLLDYQKPDGTKDYYQFATDLKKEIMDKNSNESFFNESHLDVEIAGILKSMTKGVKVTEITGDANARLMSYNTSSVANNAFHKKALEITGLENLTIVTENGIPVGDKKFQKMSNVRFLKDLNTKFHEKDVIIVNHEKMVRKQNNQTIEAALYEIKNNNPDKNVQLLEEHTLVRFINSSGAIAIPATQYNTIASKFAKQFKGTKGELLEKYGVSKLDGEWYYESQKPDLNFKRMNEMVWDLLYGSQMGKKQWEAIKNSKQGKLWKQLKYFVMFKNDNELIVDKALREDMVKYIQDTQAFTPSQKNMLTEGFSLNENNSGVLIIRDETQLPGQGYKGGDIPEGFSNKARYDKMNDSVEMYRDFYETDIYGNRVLKDRGQIPLDKQEIYDVIEKDMLSEDWVDASWADAVSYQHPSLEMMQAFMNGVHPDNISETQGNKFMGRRRNDSGDKELELVKSFGSKEKSIQELLATERVDGKVIAQVEVISGNKNLGEGSQRVKDKVIDLGMVLDKTFEEGIKNATKDNLIPFKSEEYPLLYTSVNKSYIRKSPDDMKYYQNPEALHQQYRRTIQPQLYTAEKDIQRLNLNGANRDSAKIWGKMISEQNYAQRAEGGNFDSSLNGLDYKLAQRFIDPIHNMGRMEENVRRHYLGQEVYKQENQGVKTALSPELPSDKLQHQISKPGKVYNYGEMNPSYLIGTDLVKAEPYDSNAIIIKVNGGTDKSILLSQIKSGTSEWKNIIQELKLDKTQQQSLKDLTENLSTVKTFVANAKKTSNNFKDMNIQLELEFVRHPNQASSAKILLGVKEFNDTNAHKINSVDGQRLAEMDHDGDTGIGTSRWAPAEHAELTKLQGSVKDAPKIKKVETEQASADLEWNVDKLLEKDELQANAENYKALLMQLPAMVQKMRFYQNNQSLLQKNGYTGIAIQVAKNQFIVPRREKDLSSTFEVAFNKKLKMFGQDTLDMVGNSFQRDLYSSKENLVNNILFEGEGAPFEVVMLDFNSLSIEKVTGFNIRNQAQARYLFWNVFNPIQKLITSEKNDFTSGKQESASTYSIDAAIIEYNRSMQNLDKNAFKVHSSHPLSASLKKFKDQLDFKNSTIYNGFGENSILNKKVLLNPESYLPRERNMIHQQEIYKTNLDPSRQNMQTSNNFYPEYENISRDSSNKNSTRLQKEILNEKDAIHEMDKLGYLEKRLRENEKELDSLIPIDNYNNISVGIKDKITLSNVNAKRKFGLEERIKNVKDYIKKSKGVISAKLGDSSFAKERHQILKDFVKTQYLPQKIKEKLRKKEPFDKKQQKSWIEEQAKEGRKVENIKPMTNVSEFITTQASTNWATIIHSTSQKALRLPTKESMELDKQVTAIKAIVKTDMFDLNNRKGGKKQYSKGQRNLVRMDFFDNIDILLENKNEMEQMHLIAKIMLPETTTMKITNFRGNLFPDITEKGFHSRQQLTLQYISERLAQRNLEFSNKLLDLYAEGFNESVESLMKGKPTNNLFTRTLDAIYDPGNEIFVVDTSKPSHFVAEFFRTHIKEADEIYESLSQMSAYDAILNLYGTKQYSELINNNPILNAPHIKLNERGEWVKPGKLEDEVRAFIISPEGKNILSENMDITPDYNVGYPAKGNQGFNRGKGHYQDIINKAYKICGMDKK